jgi:hypothetical protein
LPYLLIIVNTEADALLHLDTIVLSRDSNDTRRPHSIKKALVLPELALDLLQFQQSFNRSKAIDVDTFQ